jgi:RNA polymerase sigma-70 factor (ECF subfamily)
VLQEGLAIGSFAAPSLDADEERLVGQAREGDVAAFERLYRRHVGRVYALCLRLTRRASEAEDLTQEVFVRAWQKIGSFEGRSRLSSWLHRMAVNAVIDRGRARDEEISWEPTDPDAPTFDPPAPPTEPGSRADLEQAIGSLPDGARFVFVLHDVHGYRHEEIAGIAGIAVGTSKAQLHRARRLLREALSR